MYPNKTKLFIRNMVCRHCIEAVLKVCRDNDLEVSTIKLGEITVDTPLAEIDFEQLKFDFKKEGFELIENKEKQLVDKIKTSIIQMIHHADKSPEVKNSVYLSELLGYSYAYLSKLFSKHEHITIEKFIILQKIEKAKELISYKELNLSQIAFDLGYSNVQHLSSQFKSITGMSVSQFKKLEDKDRKPINELHK